MGRTVFDKREEREAELFALLAGPVITRAGRIPAQPTDNDALTRIREVFDAPEHQLWSGWRVPEACANAT
ncbi:hypothetical protein [Amycolatopsis saalfeldensis]|uniref:hypothetical protein n=1 Tax=Amycolatopsis saalfeldensis TaxID=394193 RepID=UPI000B89044C|nr:hypothetical protein [Amycolatopsis saalfeldensis]